MNILQIHPSRFEISELPGVWFRSQEQAERAVGLDLANAWTLVLSDNTLATGNRLTVYVCRAKILNDLPLTSDERNYLDKLKQLIHQLRIIGANLAHVDRDDVDELDRMLWAHYGGTVIG